MADTLFRRSDNDDLGPIEKDNPGTQPIRNLVALQSNMRGSVHVPDKN